MYLLERAKPIAVLIALSLSACASSRYTVLEPPDRSVSNYSTLEIRTFTSHLTDKDSVELADRFRRSIVCGGHEGP